jgi:PAS domain S-box-containing protein
MKLTEREPSMKRYSDQSGFLPSPTKLFLAVLVIVFLVEALVMLFLPLLLPEVNGFVTSITDALLLVVFSTPFLWWFVVRPLRSAALGERLRAAAIVETVPEAIIVADEEAMIRSFNRSAENIFGYREEEVLGRPVTILMPERYREDHEQELERALAGGETRVVGKTREAHGLRKDGREFPVELSLSTLKTREGMSFIGVIRDITERKRAQGAVEKLKADFMAMIVHDLRSPLSNLAGITSMLEEGLLGPVAEEQKKWLGKIGANVRNLIDLVNDFLDLSQLESGRIELTKEEVDLGQLIQTSLDNYFILAQDKKISLRKRVDPALARITADPRRLDQVFGNLISNALKFTPTGGEIEVGVCLENEAQIKLWVSDTGVGIAPEEISQIFQKYRQTASGKNSSHKGTGLGLVICKMIVEAHRGKIWAESEEGKRTTFTFSLPLRA